MSITAWAATLDQGSFAPTMAQAMPSRTRCLTLIWTCGGISESWTEFIQLQTCPVTPFGALHEACEECNPMFNEENGGSLAALIAGRKRDMEEEEGV